MDGDVEMEDVETDVFVVAFGLWVVGLLLLDRLSFISATASGIASTRGVFTPAAAVAKGQSNIGVPTC